MMRAITLHGWRLDDAEQTCWGSAFAFQPSDFTQVVPWPPTLTTWPPRSETLAGMRECEDAWLDEPKTFAGNPANTHYYWRRLLHDQARRTGQIILIRKDLIDGAEPEFHPYRFPEGPRLSRTGANAGRGRITAHAHDVAPTTWALCLRPLRESPALTPTLCRNVQVIALA